MATRIFVTGANGRLGLPLTRALVAASPDAEVIGLARDATKAQAVEAAGATRCLVGSLDDAAVLAEGVAGATHIYHLAGGLRGEGTVTPDLINKQGTEQLISAIKAADSGSLSTLVFTSSSAIYGRIRWSGHC